MNKALPKELIPCTSAIVVFSEASGLKSEHEAPHEALTALLKSLKEEPTSDTAIYCRDEAAGVWRLRV